MQMLRRATVFQVSSVHSHAPDVRVQAVGDIVVGSVLGPSSQRANESRIAMFLAGFPETVPVRTVNRWACVQSSRAAHIVSGCLHAV